MKKLFSALSFVFVLSASFGDDAPQVYYSSPSQKTLEASGAVQQASGMDQLKMKKIDDLQEMSAHHFGKLEEIQHQLAILDQKISGLVESIKTHQEALKRMEKNQVKNQPPRDQEKIKDPAKVDAQSLETQSTVISDNQVENKPATQSVSDAKEPNQHEKQNDIPPSTAERAHQSKPGDEIKKPAEMVEGADTKKETIDAKEKPEKPEEPDNRDIDLLKKGLLENPEQEKKVLSSEEKYKKIRAMIVRGSYKQSREELMEFIEENPNHFLLSSAYYWLGETYFVEKKYSEAAKTFMKGYKVNPSSHKVNDILLKLAMSLAALDKKQDACKTYKKLRNSEVAVSATHKHIADREEKKLGCA
ncbi:MAG: hypothetical protein CMM87_02220 [Rickettsiales bacterium]|nr:hypothetical protein [Rickettsiales bacterium]|tara:strand:+ start:6245 stop:7324 length:1080 start_codon:yes stop_codon:yes gene_type:complete